MKTESTATIKVEGKILEVDTFTYLGSGMGKTGGTEEDIKARIGKASGEFMMINIIWKG